MALNATLEALDCCRVSIRSDSAQSVPLNSGTCEGKECDKTIEVDNSINESDPGIRNAPKIKRASFNDFVALNHLGLIAIDCPDGSTLNYLSSPLPLASSLDVSLFKKS